MASEFIPDVELPDVSSVSDAAKTTAQAKKTQEAAEQFIPGHSKTQKGVSEAGTIADDVKANLVDGTRVAIDVAGIAATAATAGAGAAVAAPAAAGASAAVGTAAAGAGASAAAGATASAAGGAAASGVAGATAAKVGTAAASSAATTAAANAATNAAAAEVAKGATVEAAKAAGAEAGKNAAGGAAKEVSSEVAGSTGKKSISELIGNSTTDAPSGSSVKSRIQESIDRLNDNRGDIKRAEDAAKRASGITDALKSTDSNRRIAKNKGKQGWDKDHRGLSERILDKQQEKTGVDALKSVGKIPLIGGLLEGSANIQLRTDRQNVKMAKNSISTGIGIGLASVAILGMMLFASGAAAGGAGGAAVSLSNSGACVSGNAGANVSIPGITDGIVAGYNKAQRTNAAYIMNAGQKMGLSVQGQTIGVMTAMGESSLTVLDYGDGAGPDSRGLFQQRGNGAWGSYTDRMDPEISATSFFKKMITVAGWETMMPSAVAHAVQINADPNHYTNWWPKAVEVVGSLAGITPTAGGAANCANPINDGTWSLPIKENSFYLSDVYGPRPEAPVAGVGAFHYGLDMAPGCIGRPAGCARLSGPYEIYAPSAGTVIQAYPAGTGSYGNYIKIQHEGKDATIATLFAHLSSVNVHVGDKVAKGQVIGIMGTTGASTGVHLHFETWVNDQRQDPRLVLEPMGLKFE